LLLDAGYFSEQLGEHRQTMTKLLPYKEENARYDGLSIGFSSTQQVASIDDARRAVFSVFNIVDHLDVSI
jgi:hypothetical protein